MRTGRKVRIEIKFHPETRRTARGKDKAKRRAEHSESNHDITSRQSGRPIHERPSWKKGGKVGIKSPFNIESRLYLEGLLQANCNQVTRRLVRIVPLRTRLSPNHFLFTPPLNSSKLNLFNPDGNIIHLPTIYPF